MNKTKEARMQGLPVQIQSFSRSVFRISGDGVSDIFHMNPYLMGSASLKTAFNISKIPKSFQNSKMSDRRLPIVNNRHLLSVFRIAADRSINRSDIVGDHPVNESLIFPHHRFFRQLLGQ